MNYIEEDIGENNFFQKAVRFGDDELKNRLENYRIRGIYNKALSLASAGTNDKYEQAIPLFEKISGFKDSDEQIEICKNALNENIYQSAVKEFKKNVLSMDDENRKQYPFNGDDDTDNAVNNFKKIIEKFKDIENYKDSLDYIEKCNENIYEIRYINAKSNFTSHDIGRVGAALEKYSAIKEYKDSAEMIERCREKCRELEEAAKEEKRIDEELKRLTEEQATKKEKMYKLIAVAVFIVAIVIPILCYFQYYLM